MVCAHDHQVTSQRNKSSRHNWTSNKSTQFMVDIGQLKYRTVLDSQYLSLQKMLHSPNKTRSRNYPNKLPDHHISSKAYMPNLLSSGQA